MVKVQASMTNGQPPFSSAPASVRTFSASSRSSWMPSPSTSTLYASKSDLMPKKRNEAIAT